MEEKIIMKIKKLLSLSNSSNEEESKSAMLKAQELLAKNKLSMLDVEVPEKKVSNIIKSKTDIRFTKAKWKGLLAHIIAQNFAAKALLCTRGTNIIVFLGKEREPSLF